VGNIYKFKINKSAIHNWWFKMRKTNILIVGILILLIPLVASADTRTDLLFSDSDTLSSGYYVSYTGSISHSSTTVRVELSVSGGSVEFGVCPAGQMENWNNGSPEPSWYYHVGSTSGGTFAFELNSVSVDFCMINWGYSSVSYSISVYETYSYTPYTPPPSNNDNPASEPTSSNVGLWIGLSIGAAFIIGVVVFGLIMRKRQKAKRQRQQQAYTYRTPSSFTYQPPRPQTPSYESATTRPLYQPSTPIVTDSTPIVTDSTPVVTDSTPTDEKFGKLSFCPSCGIQITDDGKFCTNCGGKL